MQSLEFGVGFPKSCLSKHLLFTISGFLKLISDADDQHAVVDLMANADCLHSQISRILNRHDKGNFVEFDDLDRIYFPVNRRLDKPRQNAAADSARAVQTDVRNLRPSDKSLTLAVKFENDGRIRNARKFDTTDERRIVIPHKRDRRKDPPVAQIHRSSHAARFPKQFDRFIAEKFLVFGFWSLVFKINLCIDEYIFVLSPFLIVPLIPKLEIPANRRFGKARRAKRRKTVH